MDRRLKTDSPKRHGLRLPAFRFSMRFTLGATIVLMGMLGLLLALVTGEIYQNQALEHQRQALKDIVELSAAEQLQGLTNRARDLALAMQSETALRHAWNSNPRELARELHRQARLYVATARRIRLGRLTAYDAGLHPMATATPAAALPKAAAPACPALLEQVRGTQNGQTVHTLCWQEGKARYAVLVPFTAGSKRGYLEVSGDPIPTLGLLENRLGAPVRIRDTNRHNLHTSSSWPQPDAMHNALVAEQPLLASNGQAVLYVAVLRDIEALHKGLRETRYLVMTVAVVATFLGILLAISFLEKTTLRPLNALTEHLRRVSRDKNHLRETVNVSGIAEVRELADDFNQVAQELNQLYGSLEHMAFTDPLTNLPNRARFHDSLEEAARRHAQAQTPFALFLMDLDRFKNVNDTLGHQFGDLLLQEVSMRLKSVLRGSDTVARLDNETILEFDSKLIARLGGDEFAAILPRVDGPDDASAIARKLLLVMQEPFSIRDHQVSIGISIGIALYPEHGLDIDTLIQRADAAMYSAKNNQTGLAFPDTMQQSQLL